MLSIKMDRDLEIALETLAAKEGITKSEFVRQALQWRVARARQRKATIYDLTKDLCGKAVSRDPQLSTRRMRDLLKRG